jgi:hypothetical protein
LQLVEHFEKPMGAMGSVFIKLENLNAAVEVRWKSKWWTHVIFEIFGNSEQRHIKHGHLFVYMMWSYIYHMSCDFPSHVCSAMVTLGMDEAGKVLYLVWSILEVMG